jgi:hypothetical protein
MSFSTGEIVGIVLGGTAMVLLWATAIVKCAKIPTDSSNSTAAKKLESSVPQGPVGLFIHHTPGYERI